jgi:ADP-ribosyl-[dinitrogen reductase] hydrolase
MRRSTIDVGTSEDRFLGALLGMAIGDALGMPLAKMTAREIRERYGEIDHLVGGEVAVHGGAEVGEFTDETEFALCIVESMTTNQGNIDPDNIGARLQYLAMGESRKWIAGDTIQALERAVESDSYRVSLDEHGPATGDVAARGVPVGLLASVGTFNGGWLREASEAVTRLTHGSPAAIAATTAVAYGIQLAARGTEPASWAQLTSTFLESGAMAEMLGGIGPDRDHEPVSETLSQLGTGVDARESVPSAFVAATRAAVFEEAVFAAVRAGGATDTVGAIAGALAGARFGASGIPQPLIDDLEGRIYVSLAAPWFFRTALHRSGLVIDVRLEDGPGEPPPRPTMPPRQ